MCSGIVEKSRKPVSLPFPSLPFPSAERKPRFDSRFLRSYSAAILSPSLTSLGPSFSFLRRDRYPRLYYKYTCNSVRRRGSPAPLLLLPWRRTQYTSAVLTCARYLPTQPCAPRCYSVHGHVYCIWPVPYLPSYRTSCLTTFPLISSSFSFVLPWLSLSLSPSSLPRLRLLRRCSAPWAERSGTHLLARIPTARGIKYNKDIQWELIGYLRIYRSLRAALLLRRGPRDGARAPPPLFSPRSFFSSLFPTPPPSLPPLLRSLLFVFHLFAGRAAGSNGDIPRWNNIEPRF